MVRDEFLGAAGAGGGGGGGGGPSTLLVVTGVAQTTIPATKRPFDMYEWTPSGYGVKYTPSNTFFSNNLFWSSSISPNKQNLAIGASSNISTWSINSTAKTYTLLSSTALSSGNTAAGISFSPDNNYIVTANLASPYARSYAFSPITGLGTNLSNATTVPFNSTDVSFNDKGGGTSVAIPNNTNSPYINVYQYNAGVFGNKYSNPTTAIPSSAYGTHFSPDGNFLAVAHNNSPYCTVYNWSYSSGFGAKVTNPTILPPGDSSNVKFSPNGNYIALACGAAGVAVYPWSPSGFGTKYTNPVLSPSNVYDLDFSGDSTAIALGTLSGVISSNPPQVYAWSASGFGSKFSNPTTPTDVYNVYSVTFG